MNTDIDILKSRIDAYRAIGVENIYILAYLTSQGFNTDKVKEYLMLKKLEGEVE